MHKYLMHSLTQDMVRQEQQRQQQQLIASENDDDIMRGAVLAAESAAAGTDAKEDPSAVLDVRLSLLGCARIKTHMCSIDHTLITY